MVVHPKTESVQADELAERGKVKDAELTRLRAIVERQEKALGRAIEALKHSLKWCAPDSEVWKDETAALEQLEAALAAGKEGATT